jgi:hypothetical protein
MCSFRCSAVIGSKFDGLGFGRIIFSCDRKRVVTRREVSTQRQSMTRVHVVWLVRIGSVVTTACWDPSKRSLHCRERTRWQPKKLTLVELQKVVPVGGRVYMTALEAALTKLTEVMSQSVVNSEQVILRVDPTKAL